jgi:hypothetical protein
MTRGSDAIDVAINRSLGSNTLVSFNVLIDEVMAAA